MTAAPITTIRYDAAQGHEVLRDYLLAGHFGTDRPPRGVDPDQVPDIIERTVSIGAEAHVYAKALYALRFYEAAAAVPHLLQALDLPVEGLGGIERGCYAVQIGADIGTPTAELAARLVSYFDTSLVPHPDAPEAWGLLLQTRLVLAPLGTDDALAKRLQVEVDAARAHERDSEAAMMAFDKVEAVQRNDLPRMQHRAAGKHALAAEPDGGAQREAMAATYLGRKHFGGEVETWAGRWLRRSARDDAPDPVWKALADAIDATDRGRAQAQVDLEVVRAAQAILYLGGSLSTGHAQQLAAASGVANFLWDDP